MATEREIEAAAQAIRVADLPVHEGHEFCQEYEGLNGGVMLAKAALEAAEKCREKTTIYIRGYAIEIDSPDPVKLVISDFQPSRIKQLGKGSVEIEAVGVELTLVEDEVEWAIM